MIFFCGLGWSLFAQNSNPATHFYDSWNQPQKIVHPNNWTCATDSKRELKLWYIESGNTYIPTNDFVATCTKCDPKLCNCGTKLNTNIPFIGKCIMYGDTNNPGENGEGTTTVNALNAFPLLMWSLTKILMTIILVTLFATLIVGGFMMTVPDQYNEGKNYVKKVIWTIIALWSLWLILYLINPNFFT